MFDDGKFDAYAKTASTAAAVDVLLSFPSPGVIRVQSQTLFAEPDNVQCRRFLRRAFELEQLGGATLNRDAAPVAELRFDAKRHTLRDILSSLSECLGAEEKPAEPIPPVGQSLILSLVVAPAITARDRHGVVHYHRYGHVVSGFQVVAERVGFMKTQESGAVPQERPVPGHRAGIDERVGGGSLQDPFDAMHGAGGIRPAPVDPPPGHRDSRQRIGQRRASGRIGQT